MSSLVEIITKALEEAQLYQELLQVTDEEVRVGFELTDTDEAVTLILKEHPEVLTGLQKPDLKFMLTHETLLQISSYQKDAFALAARARMDDVRPINFEFLNREKMALSMETIKRLGTYFFVPGRIKIRQIRNDLAGKAHGAKPIPFAYWEGLRSAWYFLDAGQTLNEEGEKDPWPQLFIPMSGRGKALIADEEFDIEPKTVVYIPPNALHQIRAEEPVELIWIAWNAPM